MLYRPPMTKAVLVAVIILAALVDTTHPALRTREPVSSVVVRPAPAPSVAPVVEDPAPAPAPAPRACPEDMVRVESFCIDLYEFPNREGEAPQVMVDALEAEAACASAGKRLCWRDEWERACSGPGRSAYPYGSAHVAGACNSDKKWLGRDESKLNTWPSDSARGEVARVWQGEPSGSRPGCSSADGVRDLVGNVEEWTRRRDGSGPFGHAIKGGFWAREVGCGYAIESHADKFRYYEVGFRCCRPLNIGPSGNVPDGHSLDDLLPHAH